MSDLVNEQLSACLDGELSDAELQLLLKRTARDADVARPLGRYALIGEALRGTPARAADDFSSRLMAALADESPARLSPAQRLSPMLRYLRPVAGLAVAASVATVAVLSLQQPMSNGSEPVLMAAGDASPVHQLVLPESEVAPSYVVPSAAVAAARNPQVVVPAARLTNYVVAHSEYSSPLGRRSVLTGVLAGDNDDDDGFQVKITDDSLPAQSDGTAAAPQPRAEDAVPATGPVER